MDGLSLEGCLLPSEILRLFFFFFTGKGAYFLEELIVRIIIDK